MGIHRGKHPISYQRNKLLKLQRTAGRKNVRIPLFRNLCLFFSAQMQYLFHWICAVLCLVAQSCATVWIPWTEEPGRLQSVGILQARTLEWVAMPSSRIFPTQEIFPSQGLNPGLLHCRQILYSLSHQGSPLWFLTSMLFLGNMHEYIPPTCGTKRLTCPSTTDVHEAKHNSRCW